MIYLAVLGAFSVVFCGSGFSRCRVMWGPNTTDPPDQPKHKIKTEKQKT